MSVQGQGSLDVQVLIGEGKIRLAFRTLAGEFQFDMSVQQAADHARYVLTAIEHITGKKGGKLILPQGWNQ